jgi:two-component system nitrogen regulation response regulator GlnG
LSGQPESLFQGWGLGEEVVEVTMAERRLLFVHEDKELPQLLERELSRLSSWVVAFEPFGRPPKTSDNHHYDLVILESKKGWAANFPLIHPHHSGGHSVPILAIPPALFKKNYKRVLEAIQTLLEDSDRPTRSPSRSGGRPLPQDPFLVDFVERKLKDFVKKIKGNHQKNLYTLILNEFERPLISHMLKETNGNQIQAASILGLNRNTLRKKIKDLRIPLKRN